MMTKLEKAKEIIKEHIEDAHCGIFNTINTAGDQMTRIYDDDGLQIYICYYWEYYEVFGLTVAEFEELEAYYEQLLEENDDEIQE